MIDILSSILEVAMGKIIEMVSERMSLALEIHHFAFGTWNNSTPALLALVEVTNTSEVPYTISRFVLRIGNNEFRNVSIPREPEVISQHPHVVIRTAQNDIADFPRFTVDVLTPLNRPYLRQNESALGVVLFNLSHEAIEGNAITLGAVIAGHQKTFSASLLP